MLQINVYVFYLLFVICYFGKFNLYLYINLFWKKFLCDIFIITIYQVNWYNHPLPRLCQRLFPCEYMDIPLSHSLTSILYYQTWFDLMNENYCPMFSIRNFMTVIEVEWLFIYLLSICHLPNTFLLFLQLD